MDTPTFIPAHPAHVFDPADTFDYSERDSHFIRTLKAAEALRYVDAYYPPTSKTKRYCTPPENLTQLQHFPHIFVE